MNTNEMKYSKFFEGAKRVDGTKFVKCTDDAPKVFKDLIQQIHTDSFFGCLPNNWIYEVIYFAFEALEENEYDDVIIETDCYYSDLYKWLGNGFADEFCTEALQEGLVDHRTATLYKIIELGQYLAKQRILDAVNSFILEQAAIGE